MQTIHSQFNLFQPIAIGCDHAGFDYKEEIVKMLRSEGFNVKDFGTTSKDSVDYPDFAHPVAEAIEKGQVAFKQTSKYSCGNLLERERFQAGTLA